MHDTKFYRLGQLICRSRWIIIGLWLVIILACIPFLIGTLAPFSTTGFIDEHSNSAQAQRHLNKTLGYDNHNQIIIIYNSKKLLATGSAFQNKIKESVRHFKSIPVNYELILPANNKKMMSKDKHTAYAVVIVKKKQPIDNTVVDQFKSALKTPADMTVELGGEAIFIEDINNQTQEDLYKADFIATPVSIIVLILVFGSLVAALLPVLLGGGCALIILTILYILGHAFTLSIFTLNIALLLGLCLSLDYSLFIISRFRDELKNNSNITEVIAITQATAGKAILFSGLTVFASLSALLLFPINILFSVAVGGLTAVFIAVVNAIVFLPAILAVLKTKIDYLSLSSLRKNKVPRANFWRWLAQKVIYRPFLYFTLILIFLLALGHPFLSAQFGVSDFRILPKDSVPRHFYDTYDKQFSENELTPILLLVQTPNAILSRQNIGKLYDLALHLKRNPLIKQVNSIVTTDSNISESQYYKLYHASAHTMSSTIKQLLDTTTRHALTVMTIISKYHEDSPETKKLIAELRALKPPSGMSIQLTGIPVSNDDLLLSISHTLPYALLWIIGSTYFILLILLRSLFLPLKAILMNILSLCACYGALVLVFQDGYLHQLLNFEPQGSLDISLLVIIFCALFGFSMDYEVFLLSRIKECYESSQDNEQSIIFGIEKSSRIITSAAIIVISLCFSFLVADVLMIKAFGLGIAVAIFVDAFLIRIILVPTTMVLLQKWNWYLPKWLDKLIPTL